MMGILGMEACGVLDWRVGRFPQGGAELLAAGLLLCG